MNSLFTNTEIAFKIKTDEELKKAYWLFKLVQHPTLTKIGSYILKMMIHFSAVKKITQKTLFQQFCGGETQEEALAIVEKLATYQVMSILDYSVEGKESEQDFERCFQEVIHNINLSQKQANIPFVVFKPSGFGRLALYEKSQRKESLNEDERQEWERIYERFNQVCKKAYEADVLLMIDAEESWIQGAIDDLAETFMQHYNKDKCIVINTLQMYRHDRLAYLEKQYKHSIENNYYLGYKVVRGAYMEKERIRAQKMNYPSPINPTKEETDNCYNQALDFILKHNERIFLFAGTHNEYSAQKIIEYQKNTITVPKRKNIWLGQLYGMSDQISFNTAQAGCAVAKYVPYGPVIDVVPYLIRRAEENTSVAGQSNRELELIEKELLRRKSNIF